MSKKLDFNDTHWDGSMAPTPANCQTPRISYLTGNFTSSISRALAISVGFMTA
jgi:hypothetical protein